MIQKFIKLIYSTKTMAITVTLFFIAMAVATFIENDFGTPAAKAMIYNTKWFEFLMLLLVINFIGNIVIFRLYKKEKLPVFLFHLAFLIIILGAFVTRYFSYEGIMPIREGTKTNQFYSDKAYINISVDDGKWQKDFHWNVLFSRLGNKNIISALLLKDRKNDFSATASFGKTNPKDFKVELVDYIPNAHEDFVADSTAGNILHLVESGTGIRKDIFFEEGDIKSINNIIFTLNNPVDGAINFTAKNGKYQIQTPFAGKIMDMKTQKISAVPKDSLQDLTLLQLYKFADDLKFVIKSVQKGKITKISAPKTDADKYPFDDLKLKIYSGNDSKTVEVKGVTGASLKPEIVKVNGLNFNVSYGSKIYKLPFELQLRDFIMGRYPGTNSPSSFESKVTVIDPDKTFDYNIYMNHVLDYKGYRFYQASYDKDEKGTILSVNHDKIGTFITYIGYFLMGLGMFMALFWKGTRYQKLSEKIRIISERKFGILLGLFLFTTINSVAQDFGTLKQNTVNKEHAEKFGKLLIQDHQGRIKPMNTYALESLRKIYKKDAYKGLTAEQVLLSAQIRPAFWAREHIIKTKKYALGSALANRLDIDKNNYTTLISFFPNGKYILENKVANAFRKKKSNRDASDNEIINLDEKANIWLAILKGSLLNIYPKKDDPNNKWYPGTSTDIFTDKDTMIVQMHRLYLSELNHAIKTGNYTKADEYLGYIADYQKKIGKAVIPPQKKIDAEIIYNKWDIFKKLLFYYMLLGFIMLTLAFINLFKPHKKWISISMKILTVLVMIGMAFHIIGMGMRWYITGHEPWSDGYEAVVFVAFVTVFAGMIFSKNKSKFTLASTVIFASFLLGIAHGSMMNPEMTNLVPVLKSYWLMIHVAVITSSYGFLGLSALLGIIVLILFIIRNKNNGDRFKDTIEELTSISEMSMTVGLYTLSLGTFLGGVWANESWGRYWSWDPKEVWSLISMMVFVLVLHMRIIPGLRGKFAFNAAALWSITTLIMTFFGVNYYLSGMHSYAAGDPVPIPTWVPVTVVVFMIFTVISYWKYKKFEKQKPSKL